MRKKVWKLFIALVESQFFIWLCMKPRAVSSSLGAMALFCKKYTKPDQFHLLIHLPAQICLIFPRNPMYSATFKQHTLLELRLCPPAGFGSTIAHISTSEQTSWIPYFWDSSHELEGCIGVCTDALHWCVVTIPSSKPKSHPVSPSLACLLLNPLG